MSKKWEGCLGPSISPWSTPGVHSFEGMGIHESREPFCPHGDSFDRWRDILPLPPFESQCSFVGGRSVCAKRRAARRMSNSQKMNGIINAINEMAGFKVSSTSSSSKMTQAQQLAHHLLLKSVCNIPKSANHVQPREAIYELLRCGLSSYGCEEEARSTVRSYNKALISLPDSGAQVFDAGDLIDDVGRGILQDPYHHLFEHSISSKKSIKPYMDEVLRSSPPLYHEFVGDLYDRGMLTFGTFKKAGITPFFVIKKNGKLRLVLDCRATNEHFKKPPDIAMAAGYSFGQLEVSGEQEVFVAQSDIKDYFYSIGLPSYLHPFFSLPPIRPRLLRHRIPELRGLEHLGEVYPQMKVVPMGWSWAMFFAQRIHQHQVMIGTGISHEQVLADGRPAPSLDSGKCVIIPYADNLNVVGINQKAVQDVKDLAVRQLRKVGFRVHEEEDACTYSKALGFIIDGKNRRIYPVPEKRDKVIAALRWLSNRPKVTGKCIERIVGHCIHFFMLKRELLSIFRSVYDFKIANYNKQVRLWRTAADECRWAADLLWICESDLAKEWSGNITVSDACLSGTAVCSLESSSDIARQLGITRELWRYKGRGCQVKARDVVRTLDPFYDIETVLDDSLQFLDPFQLNQEFENVSKDIATSSEWDFQFASRMKMPEAITVLEGRATVQSIRHKCRSMRHFNKRHVHLGDNLGMVLAFDRGRAKAIPLLLCCRRAAAFSIATATQFHHRWIPSEWNAADGPSRQFECNSEEKAKCSKTLRKETIQEIIYPSSSPRQAKALRNAASSFGHSSSEGCGESGSTMVKNGNHEPSSYGGEGQNASRSERKKIHLQQGQQVASSFSGSVLPGIFCSISKDSLGLSEANSGFSKLLQATGIEDHNSFSSRRSTDDFSEPMLHGRPRHIGSYEVLCSNIGSPSKCRERWSATEQKDSKGMEESRPRPTKDSFSMAIGGIDRFDYDESGSHYRSSMHSHNVLNVCQAKRGSKTAKEGRGEDKRAGSDVGHKCERLRESGDIKSRDVGRSNSSRQSRHGVSGAGFIQACSRGPNSSSVQPPVSSTTSGLDSSADHSGFGPKLCRPVPDKTLRGFLGQTEEAKDNIGDQTQRSMELGFKPASLRQPCKSCPVVREASASDQEESRGIACVTQGDGYRIFHPKKVNGKPAILEFFAGCASLSKAFCRLGFTVHAFDIQWGPGGDILHQDVFRKICASISRGVFSFVHFGMPCESWSRARKHDCLGPPPLRDDFYFLYGLKNLSSRDAERIERGNRLLKKTFQLAMACIKYGVPWTIENPFSSRAWLTHEMQKLVHLGASFQNVHYCQYRKPWKKATSFLGWRIPNLHFQLCSGKNGICSATGQKHVLLQGQNNAGIFRTLLAQPYPSAMTQHITAVISQSL